jgi:hypothetical protein
MDPQLQAAIKAANGNKADKQQLDLLNSHAHNMGSDGNAARTALGREEENPKSFLG